MVLALNVIYWCKIINSETGTMLTAAVSSIQPEPATLKDPVCIQDMTAISTIHLGNFFLRPTNI
jgi:hypothetical protein